MIGGAGEGYAFGLALGGIGRAAGYFTDKMSSSVGNALGRLGLSEGESASIVKYTANAMTTGLAGAGVNVARGWLTNGSNYSLNDFGSDALSGFGLGVLGGLAGQSINANFASFAQTWGRTALSVAGFGVLSTAGGAIDRYFGGSGWGESLSWQNYVIDLGVGSGIAAAAVGLKALANRELSQVLWNKVGLSAKTAIEIEKGVTMLMVTAASVSAFLTHDRSNIWTKDGFVAENFATSFITVW